MIVGAPDDAGTLVHDGTPGGCDDFTLTATALDPEMDVLSYQWNSVVIGLDVETCVNSTSAYLCLGIHDICVSVSDPYGDSSSEECFTFTVNPEDNLPPTAEISGLEQEYQIGSDCLPGGYYDERTRNTSGGYHYDEEKDKQ